MRWFIVGVNAKDPDNHALRCNPARAHPSRPPFSTTIDSSNPLSMSIFSERQGLEEKLKLATFYNRVDTEIERRTEFDDVYQIQLESLQLAAKSQRIIIRSFII